MNALKRKLGSDRGASITFGLLVFLVCAVISSVVIVASTSVGGRLSQIAETDRRYYAVTSAVELLKDTLNGQGVTVQAVTQKNETVPFENGTEKTPSSSSVTSITVTVNGNVLVSTDNLSLLEDAACHVLDAIYAKDKGYEVGSAEYKAPIAPIAKVTGVAQSTWVANKTKSLGFAFSGSGLDDEMQAAMAVTIREEVQDNGIITFYVTSDNAPSAYTLKITFKADVDSSKSSKKVDGTPKNVKTVSGVTTYEVSRSITETINATMTWKLMDIEKSKMPTTT